MFLIVLVLNKIVYFLLVIIDFFEFFIKISDIIVGNLLLNNDFLKNSVLIVLFGVFVLICFIFVIVYIYFKCFKKN